MFKTPTDVRNYITLTIAKFAKEYSTWNYKIEYSNRLSSSLATVHHRYLMGKCVSLKFVFNNKFLNSFKENEEEIKDTVLHEIAHAIAGGNHHHDRVWKDVCNRLGCKPSRFKDVNY